MANWKKVIVSGSSAALAGLTLDTALPVASGGTGGATFTDGALVVGSGTGALTSLGQATDGQVVIGSSGADPVLATLQQGSNISITNTAGGIEIAATGLGSGTVQSVSGTGTENGITLTSDGDSVNPTLTLGGALTGVANAQLVNNSVTLGTTSVALGATATTLAGLTLTTAVITGSFTGSFTGTTDLPDLVSGGGLTGGPYDGSLTKTFAVGEGTGITVAADTVGISDAGVTATQLATSVAGAGLAGGAGTALSVNVDGTSLEITTDTLNVKALGVSNAMLAGSIVNAKLVNDSVTLGTTEVALGATASAIAGLTLTAATITGSFSGSFIGTTDLPDLVSGGGLTGGPYDGSVTKTLAVGAGTGITVAADTVGISNAGVTATQLAASVAGAGLSGGAGTALSVNVDDTSIEITTDTLNIKDLGVTNAMLAGSITNAKLVNDDVTLGTTSVALGATATTLAGLTLTGATASGSFSGSFQGDGSNLTGIATTLDTSGNTGAGSINLVTDGLAVTGTGAISTVASNQGIAISAADASAVAKGIASFASSNFAVTAGDVALSNDVTIGQDLVVTRNLTVQGTASFNSEQNLDVADRFIRMASGSLANGDGGIAIQQTGPTDAEAFGWDSNIARWGVTGSFDASQNALIPDAFLSLVTDGGASNDPADAPTKYTKKGNMFIGADENVWIYS